LTFPKEKEREKPICKVYVMPPDAHSGHADNVRVVVRSRPFSLQEEADGRANIVHVDHINGVVKLDNPNQTRFLVNLIDASTNYPN